jgi:hydrogenase maturation factor
MIIIVPLIVFIVFLAWTLRPGKNPTAHRRNAILGTAIPSLIVAIAAVLFQLFHNASGTIEVSDISNTLFIAGLGLIGAYILISVGFAVARKGNIAKGIGFGTCIAVVISIVELGFLEWLGGV